MAGLLFPSAVYPDEEVRRAFLANDVVNLVIGLPVLLGTLWLLRRGNLFGLLGLLGALFYVVRGIRAGQSASLEAERRRFS